jgi:hypothetical protein
MLDTGDGKDKERKFPFHSNIVSSTWAKIKPMDDSASHSGYPYLKKKVIANLQWPIPPTNNSELRTHPNDS